MKEYCRIFQNHAKFCRPFTFCRALKIKSIFSLVTSWLTICWKNAIHFILWVKIAIFVSSMVHCHKSMQHTYSREKKMHTLEDILTLYPPGGRGKFHKNRLCNMFFNSWFLRSIKFNFIICSQLVNSYQHYKVFEALLTDLKNFSKSIENKWKILGFKTEAK